MARNRRLQARDSHHETMEAVLNPVGLAAGLSLAEVRQLLDTESRDHASDVLLLRERLSELELEYENAGWIRLTERAEREFSRDGLRQIARDSRLMFLKNPIINRMVTVQSQYVFGQGISVTANSSPVQDVLNDFIDDTGNQDAFTSQQAQMELDQQITIDGNFFPVFFPNPLTGAVKIRLLPFDEITEIICNPEDRQDPWYYKREWNQRSLDYKTGLQTETSMIAYYPDWRYQPTVKPPSIGGKPIMWTSPVAHRRVGGLRDMQWGIPETYAALDWALAYKGLLENDATRARALTRIANMLVQQNSTPASRAKAQTLLNTTIGNNNEIGIDRNPPPVTGSTMVMGAGTEYKATNLSGAMLPPDHGRPIRMMAIAAGGIPETFYGDASVGTLATAKSLDRPTELKFMTRRELWRDFWLDLANYLIDWSLKAPQGRLTAQTVTDPFGKRVQVLADDPATDEPMDRSVDVSFPSILEHDKSAEVSALVSAFTLNGFTDAGVLDPKSFTRQLLGVLDFDNIDEVMDLVYPPDDAQADDGPTTQTTTEEAFMEAVRTLTEKVRLIA